MSDMSDFATEARRALATPTNFRDLRDARIRHRLRRALAFIDDLDTLMDTARSRYGADAGLLHVEEIETAAEKLRRNP